MNRALIRSLAMAASVALLAISPAAAKGGNPWLDRAMKWVEKTGQVTVIHQRFCRHIEVRCSRFGEDVKVVTLRDEDGEHDLSVVQRHPKVAMFFSMTADTNILFAMHRDGSVYHVIEIDLVSQEHIELPVDAKQDLFRREWAFWQRHVPTD